MEKGSSSSSSSSLNGLNFGKKIYFENVGSSGLQSSPSKKGRSGGVVQGGQPPRCQVEGCKVDLSDAKAYYSRHKVCGMHSKSPKVIVAGIEQRFCQQCSRFHQLPEFDQGKRSCRRRLAGHNERRRKPPSVSTISPRYGSLSPTIFDNYSKPGGFVLDFSSSHPNLTGKDSWANTSSERGLGNQLSWQSNSQNPQPDFLQGSSTSSRPSYSGHGVSSVECFGGVSSDSSGALSLLSNQPWGSRTRASSLGLNNFLGTTTNGDEGTLVQPSVNAGATMGQLACPSWGFKDNHGNNTLHEMPPDLVLGHISHPANTQYTGELGLAQPIEGQYHELDHSRGYDSTVQHMHWSL